ncbi:ATP-binding protein [Altericroceibacterium xinjiangense]|uniref:ATP-binding protein n=1 Tax=Altericroceibacterium xinjiangense TaxID=762261 RepID=UPI000F7D7640|nr:ATP-binding protein [Altericroceibacterium xinjiangense]
MNASILLGSDKTGAPVQLDIEELLATRLLVQGNSGSGKSHLLRRLLEESAGMVQQVIIDPEGDFVSLAEPFGHVVIDGSAYADAEIGVIGARIREHRASVILALDGLEIDSQMRCAALFLSALFDAPAKHWYPALVIVDEAQVFAPAAAGEVSDEARRTSLAAMTNLMCRGRKRGLAGVIATQRIAKLAKNVAAEASNFLMGRTFLDIDMARAADLLGMERRQAEQIRDLERGHFLGLGPAISRRPVAVKVGAVQTSARSVSPGLMPPPPSSPQEMEALLHADLDEATSQPAPVMRREPEPAKPDDLHERISGFTAPLPPEAAPEPSEPEDVEPLLREVLAEMTAEEGCTFQPAATLFQDFNVRCRMRGLRRHGLDAMQFKRRFAVALAGLGDEADAAELGEALRLAEGVPDDLVAPFLMIAKAAAEGAPCPDDDTLARIYGTNSLGRVRRLLEYLEKMGLIVIRTDFGGRRTVTIPELNLTTLAA